jgi:hypothetical protein
VNLDEKHISKLYESISTLDFLNSTISEDSFNWNSFFKEAHYHNTFSTFLESFELVDSIENKNEKIEKYEIITSRNRKFNLFITYQGKDKSDLFLMANIRRHEAKNNPELLEYFQNLKNNLKEDGILCFVRFEDEEKRTNLTGEVGITSFEVFSALRNAVLSSMSKKMDLIRKTEAIIVLVHKSEEDRRISLYTRMLKRETGFFPNVKIDRESDPEFTYVIGTK